MADRKLVVTIVGDDSSFQSALNRSTVAAQRFAGNMGRTLGGGVSAGRNFGPLLDDVKRMNSEADNLTKRLRQMDEGFAGAGEGAGVLSGGLAATVGKATLAGFAISATYQASRQLQEALKTTGTEAFTTSGKLRNFASALLATDVVGAIQALRAAPKTVEELGISATQASFRLDALQKVADGTAQRLREQGQSAEGSKSSLEEYESIVDRAGTSNQKFARELLNQVAALKAAENAQDALADATARLGTVFETSTGQAVTFKGAVDDLGGLRGPGLVDQINANLRQSRGGFGQQISPEAANAAAQTVAAASGNLGRLLKLQKEELARVRKARDGSFAVGKEYEKLNQDVAAARAAVISTERQIKAQNAAAAAQSEAARKAALAAAEAAKRRAEAERKAALARLAALREAQRVALQERQFRALGLTPGGEELVPRVANLQKQLSQLTGRLVSEGEMTPKIRGQLNRIGRVLDGAFGKVTEQTRSKIRDMFSELRRVFDDESGKPLHTRTFAINRNALLKGLGLDPEAERILKSRLQGFNTAGIAQARPAGAFGAFGMAFTPGGQPINITTEVVLDGQKVGRSVTRFQGARSRSNPKQKRGPVAGI